MALDFPETQGAFLKPWLQRGPTGGGERDAAH